MKPVCCLLGPGLCCFASSLKTTHSSSSSLVLPCLTGDCEAKHGKGPTWHVHWLSPQLHLGSFGVQLRCCGLYSSQQWHLQLAETSVYRLLVSTSTIEWGVR